FGLVMSEVQRLPAISHNGGLHGWSSNLMWLPRQHTTLVALGNALPPAPGLTPAMVTHEMPKHFLAEDIARLAPLVEDTSIDSKTYATYVGRYDYQGAVMTITVEKDRLFSRLSGQGKFEIFPKGKDEFFWKIADAS